MLLKEIEVFEKLEASLKSTKRGNLRKPRSVHAGSNKPRTRDSGFREAPRSTGCLVCGIDRDHTNILLCEGCNGEYHTYCLLPPLKSIPQDDWFCGELDVLNNVHSAHRFVHQESSLESH
jgi:hypothetical protein